MKKCLLFSLFLLFTVFGFSQTVVFEVLTPDPVTGIYPLTYSTSAQGWSAMPDLALPENAVTGELVFVSDGTAADSLACNPLVNGAEVDGKIAVIWRGSCEFGVKSHNAWEAGAIAVILVNNAVGEAPILAGAGTSGLGELVTVPVTMTDRATGELLREYILAGTATALLGLQIFENDITMTPGNVIRPDWAAKPSAIVQNADDFTLAVGTFVSNSGNAYQTGVSLTATITFGDDIIYNESASALEIESGAEIFIALPEFSQDSYEMGEYVLVYTIDSDLDEEFPVDNVPITSRFTITSDIFSYHPVNPETEMIEPTRFTRAATFDGFLQPCAHFRDANASMLRAEGIYTAAQTAVIGDVISDQILEAHLYEWGDEFENTDAPEIPIALLNASVESPTAFGEFAFTSEDQQGQVVYIPFEEPVVLQDNMRYLFCITTTNANLNLAFASSSVDYTSTQALMLQPITPLFNAANFFVAGFGYDVAAAHAVQLVDITVGTDNTDRVDITPYPNPTRDFIAIPYAGSAASATIHIYDLTGRLVKSVNANYGGDNMIQIDMNGVTNGSYVFNMQFNDNTSSTFKVVVAR